MKKPIVQSSKDELIEFVRQWLMLCINDEINRAYSFLDLLEGSESLTLDGFRRLIKESFVGVDESLILDGDRFKINCRINVGDFNKNNHASGWWIDIELPLTSGPSQVRLNFEFLISEEGLKFLLDDYQVIKTYEQNLDEESQKALEVLGKGYMQCMHSSDAEVTLGSSVVEVDRISIGLGRDERKFLIIERGCSEVTLKSDYCQMIQCRIKAAPRDIEVDEKGGLSDNFRFYIGPQKKISKIIVLQEKVEDEVKPNALLNMIVDSGLVIEFEDQSRVSIIVEQDCVGRLKLDSNPLEKDELLVNHVERLII